MAFLAVLVAIVATWFVLSAIVVGVGLPVQRRLMGAAHPVSVPDAFWAGFAAVIAFLQVWHFFFAITWVTLAIVAVTGSALLVRDGGRSLRFERLAGWEAATLVLLTLWLADHASGSPNAWDSAMYHMQVVRWANTYPLVPGLGNLHDRLAFNTSSTLYFAMLNTGLWRGRATHIAMGLLVLMLLVQLWTSTKRVSEGEYSSAFLFDVVLWVPLAAIVASGGLSSYLTDIPPAIVLFVAGSRLFGMLSRTEGNVNGLQSDVGFVLVLSTVAVCLKTSSLTVAPILVLVTLWWAGRQLPWTETFGILRTLALLVLVLGIPWIAQEIVMTGYPLFPNTVAALPVAWKVPVRLALSESTWIRTYARHSAAPGLGWIRQWFFVERHGPTFLQEGIADMFVPLMIATAMLVFRVLAALRGLRPVSGAHARGWLVLVPTCGGLLLWFWLAPAPRFGFALFWIAAATCTAQTLPYYRLRGALLGGMVGALISLVLMASAFVAGRGSYRQSVHILAGDVLLPPGPDHGLQPIERADLETFATDSGLMLSVPILDNRCFDAPLPCTPHPARNLVVRQTWDGRPEFITNGDWHQLNWPNRTVQHPERFTK